MSIGMFMKKAFNTSVTLVTSAVVMGSFAGCAAPAKVAEETVAADTPKTVEDSSVLSEASFGDIKNNVVRSTRTTVTTTKTNNNISTKTTKTQIVTVPKPRPQRSTVVRRKPASVSAPQQALASAQANAREEEWLNYQRKWEQDQARRRSQASRRAPRTQVAQVRQQTWRNDNNVAQAQAWSDAPRAPRQQLIQIAMAPVIDAGRLSNAAVSRTRTNVMYDGRYIPLRYPNGDVPSNIGVCTDVVIRSYRQLGVDLQRLLHEDMTYNFNSYPNLPKWGLNAPDPNIDHRRVHNLKAFFARYGQRLPITHNPSDYQPGDIVTWSLGGDQEHIGVVVDRYSDADPRRPLIVHHIDARGVKMEDMLFTLPITGHYRYLGGAGTTQLVSM
ncbi:DUF1287 domain-containing protein [Thiofilum sp.]|uniref:DUF1287 domain-containing protein n=1 Tax=Thiofilum sp. TaxID=2212733 RepID=UPI0025E6142A|nr:DUF1287 domain-containing protein [Thiofilum sp.]